MKILIVDDEAAYCELTCDSLSGTYDTVGCTTPGQAIQAITQQHFDLAIIDVYLEMASGFELCMELQEISPHLGIIFLSGSLLEEDILRGYELGALDYIRKPIGPPELKEKVDRLLELRERIFKAEGARREAEQAAFNSMAMASKFGAIVSFLDSSISLRELEDVIITLEGTCVSLGLNVSIMAFHDHETIAYNTMTPLEAKVIKHARHEARIVDHKNRSLFNAAHLSILVKNMPTSDPDDYGLLKDILAPLVTGASSRVSSILQHHEVELARADVVSALDLINTTMSDQSAKLNALMERYLVEIKQTMMLLDLTESQEDLFLSDVDLHMKEMVAIVSEQGLVEKQLGGVITRLSALKEA